MMATAKSSITTIQTIPQTTLPVGAGQITLNNLDSLATGIAITLDEISWPYTGGLALTYTLSVSYDAGQTFVPIVGPETVSDDPIPASKNRPANQFAIFGSIDPQVGATKRRMRVDWDAAKSVTISGAYQFLS